jgi:Zn-dependent protease with chaperone function
MRPRPALGGALAAIALLTGSGCALESTTPSKPAGRTEAPAPSPTASQKTVDPAQVQRLKTAMIPLLKVMDKPLSPSQVKVGIIDDPQINAANGGNGEFYVTTGLLQKANDDQLLAVLAHEVAHQDLGHVAKAQTLGAGLGIGAVILDQVIPGAGRVAPIVGALIQNKYSQKEEYAADRHGVDLLQRVGRNKELMISTLTWLMDTSGGSDGGGGFLSTHPATGDRIEQLRRL